MRFLSGLYGRAAQLRRAWYGRHPERVHRLAQPVISVGNLVVGGSGKTPTVAAIAHLLQNAGERPAILSRGYGRRTSADGVVVVSDGRCVQVPTEQSGDEPQMLARALSGVPVLVSPDRYLAGCLAERRFGCTVHILDDGFQHMQLARDINLLVASAADLDERLLPFGRLREPLGAARAADAVLVAGDQADVAAVASRLGVSSAFHVQTRQRAPRFILEHRTAAAGRRVLAVAGIARPARFFSALRAGGWDVVREITFRDHHWFSERDLVSIHRAASDEKVDLVLTTEKDVVRLDPGALVESPVSWAAIPVEVLIGPPEGGHYEEVGHHGVSAHYEDGGQNGDEQVFVSWMQERLAAARRRGAEAA